jgi:hypothetical protein
VNDLLKKRKRYPPDSKSLMQQFVDRLRSVHVSFDTPNLYCVDTSLRNPGHEQGVIARRGAAVLAPGDENQGVIAPSARHLKVEAQPQQY